MSNVSLIDGHIDGDAAGMTDNEIIKAYGCCNLSRLSIDELGGCESCPCKVDGGKCLVVLDRINLEQETFDLLNRQQAEIERLKKIKANILDVMRENIEQTKAEAIKEFTERLKERKYLSSEWSHGEHPFVVEESDIEDVLEEMVGEVDAT